jgi:putative aminopeptidase FrvX
MQELAKRLSEAFGVSGFEDEIRAVIRAEIAGLVDEVSVDTLGNLIAVRRGAGGGLPSKRVMLAAHMDQIGLMVTHVDEQGYLRFAPVGHLYPLACWGAQVRFADGTVGTIGLDGRKSPAKELPELRDMYVDVGATGRDQVRQKVGDVAGFWPGFTSQGNAWFSPNLDDRAGCIVLVQLLRELQGAEIAHDVYAVFTTQEEVGTRGARTSAYAIEPDLAIALDVTLTGDAPYATPAMEVFMGRGVAIKVKDSGMISHPVSARGADGCDDRRLRDAGLARGGAGHVFVHPQPPCPHPLADRGSARCAGCGPAVDRFSERADRTLIEPRGRGDAGTRGRGDAGTRGRGDAEKSDNLRALCVSVVFYSSSQPAKTSDTRRHAATPASRAICAGVRAWVSASSRRVAPAAASQCFSESVVVSLAS